MNISEIAKLSGVSSATVSRIINNVGYVKDETRERVLGTMRAVGYVPSNIARSLSKGETPFLGVIVPDIVNPFFSELVKAIERVAEESGFRILFFDTDEDSRKEHSVLATIREHWIRGLLIAPVSCEDEVTGRLLLELESSGIPVVLLDREFRGQGLSGVRVDNFQGGYDATKALLTAGHRKIGIITGPWQEGPGDGRLKGYLQALQDAGVEPRPEHQTQCSFRMSGGYVACRTLMEQPDPPTAIFSCGSTMAVGCLQYFGERLLRLGEDVGFISFDEVSIINMLEYNLSTVGCSLPRLGEEAFRLLARRFGEDAGDRALLQQKVLPARLTLRGSERCRESAPAKQEHDRPEHAVDRQPPVLS